MGLFTRMKDPTRGVGKVVSKVGMPGYNQGGRMRLIVTAEGVEPTPVELRIRVAHHQGAWAAVKDEVPVTVDRADPQKFRVEWSEIPNIHDIVHKQADQDEQRMLAEMRGEAQPDQGTEVEEARQMWRENLERGFCTQEEFDKEMRELDEDLQRD